MLSTTKALVNAIVEPKVAILQEVEKINTIQFQNNRRTYLWHKL